MRVGSLFSGVGGFDIGLERAGFEHGFFCEIDEWRRGILAHHWPGVPIYTDVRDVARDVDLGEGEEGDVAGRSRTVGGVGHRSDVQPDDRGLDAGDHRVHPEPEGRAAGSRGRGGSFVGGGNTPDELHRIGLLVGGFPCQDVSVAGKRAGLAGERSGLFFEYARIVESVRPRWLLIENVPGLLSSNGGRDFGVVLGTLADLGYSVAWRVLDSRFFGVPQRRRRVFIVGTLAHDDLAAAARRAGQVLAVGTRCTRHSQARGEAGEGSPWASADGSDGSRVAGTLGKLTGGPKQDLDGHGAYITKVAAPLLNPQGGLRSTDLDGAARVVTPVGSVRRLTPIECERLQAWPDNWTAPTGREPDSRRYAAAGDGVTATVAEWIGRRIQQANKEKAS